MSKFQDTLKYYRRIPSPKSLKMAIGPGVVIALTVAFYVIAALRIDRSAFNDWWGAAWSMLLSIGFVTLILGLAYLTDRHGKVSWLRSALLALVILGVVILAGYIGLDWMSWNWSILWMLLILPLLLCFWATPRLTLWAYSDGLALPDPRRRSRRS